MDGATPIVVIDTNDILQSLQRATQKNREREAASKEEIECETKSRNQNHMNGSV